MYNCVLTQNRAALALLGWPLSVHLCLPEGFPNASQGGSGRGSEGFRKITEGFPKGFQAPPEGFPPVFQGGSAGFPEGFIVLGQERALSKCYYLLHGSH